MSRIDGVNVWCTIECHTIVTPYQLRRSHSMKNRKTRRSRCASDTCGKQFRHADPLCGNLLSGLPFNVSAVSVARREQEREVPRSEQATSRWRRLF